MKRLKGACKKSLLVLLYTGFSFVGVSQSFTKYYHYGENDSLKIARGVDSKFNFFNGGYVTYLVNENDDIMVQSVDSNGDLLWLNRYILPNNMFLSRGGGVMDMDLSSNHILIHGLYNNSNPVWIPGPRFTIGIDIFSGAVDFAETYASNIDWNGTLVPDYETNNFQKDKLIHSWLQFSPFGLYGISFGNIHYDIDGYANHCYPNDINNSIAITGTSAVQQDSSIFFTMELDVLTDSLVGDFKRYSLAGSPGYVGGENRIDFRQHEGYVTCAKAADPLFQSFVNVTRLDSNRDVILSKNFRFVSPPGVSIVVKDIEKLTSADRNQPDDDIILSGRAFVYVGANIFLVPFYLVMDFTTLNPILSELRPATLDGFLMNLDTPPLGEHPNSFYGWGTSIPHLNGSIALQESVNALYLTTNDTSCISIPLPLNVQSETVTVYVDTIDQQSFVPVKDTFNVLVIPATVNVYDCDNTLTAKRNAIKDMLSDRMDINEFAGLFETATGVEELSDNVEFGVYPNPNNGRAFNIVLGQEMEEQHILRVSDVYGKTVRAIMVNSGRTTLNFDAPLKAGIYFLIVNGKMPQKLVVR